MSQLSKITIPVPVGLDPLQVTAALTARYQDSDYYAYEREGFWFVGLGRRASLSICSIGEIATLYEDQGENVFLVMEPLANLARQFVSRHSTDGRLVFGFAGSNYGAHVRKEPYVPGYWPLLSLMAPIIDVTVSHDQISLAGYDKTVTADLHDFLNAILSEEFLFNNQSAKPHTIDLLENADLFLDRVKQALCDIFSAKRRKVIISRTISLAGPVDMPSTLYHGRRENTPSRTYSFSQKGYKATGFSPELVVKVESGKVTSEPVAGTRPCNGTEAENEAMRRDLLNDPKEIIEHMIGVQRAMKRLNELCNPGTVVAEDLLSVLPRGSIQHIYSRVAGHLSLGNDEWDSLASLLPSMRGSYEEIKRLEPRPRELYMGSVLFLESPGSMDAAFAIRAVFQDPRRQWLQVGAGIVSKSQPEDELAETSHKLTTIHPYVMEKIKTKL